MNRRRFLAITAAALAAGPATAADWTGTALGADLRISLTGPGADRALSDLPDLIDRIDATFSLYRPSELQQLNRSGTLRPGDWLARALALSDRLHRLTNGAFDPTVQPLWRALAEGGDIARAQDLVGWERITLGPTVRLAQGQALTLNGMAQGFAADLVRDWLASRGFTRALIDMGETAALGGPYRLGLGDIGDATLSDTALAFSQPGALMVGGRPHILHPRGQAALWSSVAVEAGSAALADGLSTALVFLSRDHATALKAAEPDLRRIWLTDASGTISL